MVSHQEHLLCQDLLGHLQDSHHQEWEVVLLLLLVYHQQDLLGRLLDNHHLCQLTYNKEVEVVLQQ